jgi:hypothetical protein
MDAAPEERRAQFLSAMQHLQDYSRSKTRDYATSPFGVV